MDDVNVNRFLSNIFLKKWTMLKIHWDKFFKNWTLSMECHRCEIKWVESGVVNSEVSALSGMFICYLLAQQWSNKRYFGHCIVAKGKTSNYHLRKCFYCCQALRQMSDTEIMFQDFLKSFCLCLKRRKITLSYINLLISVSSATHSHYNLPF